MTGACVNCGASKVRMYVPRYTTRQLLTGTMPPVIPACSDDCMSEFDKT
jgi:hypothetical protein